MSVVVPFPGSRGATRGAQRSHTTRTPGALRPGRAGSVISWVRAASCDCCARPTLAAQTGLGRATLCSQCRPPSIA